MRAFSLSPGGSGRKFQLPVLFLPLYTLGKKCGGNCFYDHKGRKSCKNCAFPHEKDHYDAVMARYGEIAAVVKRSDMEET